MLKVALMNYVPQRYMRRADFDRQENMRHILDFKAGRKYASRWASRIVGRALSSMDLSLPNCRATIQRRYCLYRFGRMQFFIISYLCRFVNLF